MDEEERAEGEDVDEAGSETEFTGVMLGMNGPDKVMGGPRMIGPKVGWVSADPLLAGDINSLTDS